MLEAENISLKDRIKVGLLTVTDETSGLMAFIGYLEVLGGVFSLNGELLIAGLVTDVTCIAVHAAVIRGFTKLANQGVLVPG